MENEQIQAAIRPCLNQKMVYKGDIYLFKKFIIGGNTISIYTEEGPKEIINFQRADFETQFAKVYPATEGELVLAERKMEVQQKSPEHSEVEVMPHGNLAIQTVITKNSQKLADLLLNNIEKIKASPAYIPQASALNEQVKTLIDLGKAELEAIKVATSIKTK